jgi:hypothetical protein
MACTSIVTGAGVAPNCTSRNNTTSQTFNGVATFESGTYGNCSGLWLAIDGVRLGQPYFYYGDATVSVNCPELNDNPCDCINGGCLPATTYKTPGKYANLAACLSGCAKDSNCMGECVSAAELGALSQAANQLQSKFCG